MVVMPALGAGIPAYSAIIEEHGGMDGRAKPGQDG